MSRELDKEKLYREFKVKMKEIMTRAGEITSDIPEVQTRKNHRRVIWKPEGPERTKQAFMKECDINEIMRKFAKTGELPAMMKKDPVYGDFSDLPTFEQAMQTVIMAETQFAALSGAVRGRFDNDPRKFLEFVNDEKNMDEMVKMGLAEYRKPEPEPKPIKVEMVEIKKPKKEPIVE